jgi:hypothetical protein
MTNLVDRFALALAGIEPIRAIEDERGCVADIAIAVDDARWYDDGSLSVRTEVQP